MPTAERASSPAVPESGGEDVVKIPSSPMSSASSTFDSNLSDLSMDDSDFEFINTFSEDEEQRAYTGSDDETPRASYTDERQARDRTTSGSSDEEAKQSASKLSFSFPDPENDEQWITDSEEEAPVVVEAPETPKRSRNRDTDGQKGIANLEGTQEDLDGLCKTVDWQFESKSAIAEGEQSESLSDKARVVVVQHNSLLAVVSTYTRSLHGKSSLFGAAALGLALLAAAGASLFNSNGTNGAAILAWPFSLRHAGQPVSEPVQSTSTSYSVPTPKPTVLLLSSPTSFLTIAATPHAANPKKNMKALATAAPKCEKCALSTVASGRPSAIMRTDASTSRTQLAKGTDFIFYPQRHPDALIAALMILNHWPDYALNRIRWNYHRFQDRYSAGMQDLSGLQKRAFQLWFEVQKSVDKPVQAFYPAQKKAKHLFEEAKRHLPTIDMKASDQARLAKKTKALLRKANANVGKAFEAKHGQLLVSVRKNKQKGRAAYKHARRAGQEKVRKASRVAKKLKKHRKVLEGLKSGFARA